MKAVIIIMVCGVAAAGCGGSDGGKAPAKGKATADTEAPRRIPQGKGMALPLGTNQSRAIKDLGTPEAVLESAPFRCFVYATDGGEDTWLRMCFKDDKLTGVGTIVGRKNAMTLDVPDAKGPGKVKRPKSSRKTVPVLTPTPTP